MPQTPENIQKPWFFQPRDRRIHLFRLLSFCDPVKGSGFMAATEYPSVA